MIVYNHVNPAVITPVFAIKLLTTSVPATVDTPVKVELKDSAKVTFAVVNVAAVPVTSRFWNCAIVFAFVVRIV